VTSAEGAQPQRATLGGGVPVGVRPAAVALPMAGWMATGTADTIAYICRHTYMLPKQSKVGKTRGEPHGAPGLACTI
jgi:hypothetical protein